MRDFTQGSILKQLISFTVPMLFAYLLQAMNNLVGGIWIGKLIGHEAFAAVSIAQPIFILLISAIVGLTIGTNILVGHAFGAKNMDYLGKVLANSFISSVIMSVVLSALGIIFSNQLLDLVNTPASIKPQAHLFFVIVLGGLIFIFIYNWFSAILRGLGDAKTPFYLLLISVALNIILTPTLIMGLGPIPKMGIAGAAWGAVIGNILMLFIAYYLVFRKHPLLNIGLWNFTIDLKTIKKIFAIGIPVSLQMIAASLSALFIISLVNKFGTDVTAAYGIGLQLDQLSFMPAMAIGISASSMIAQNLGAGRFDRVKRIINLSLLLSFCLALIFFFAIYGFPKQAALLFTDEPRVIAHAVKYIHIVSFTYIIFSLVFVLHGVVRGAGDTMLMLLFTFIALIIVRYPLAIILSRIPALKETGIWLALLISSFVALILNYFYYLSGRWKKSLVSGGKK